ncbi:MAG: DHH family phosphoesterase, partial [bacterium]|nr:DHH family phosphoesterase [bacterium]
MADISIQQQIFESLNKANRILIPLASSPSGDSLAAALAMYSFLKKLNKEPWLVSFGSVPDRFDFLPQHHEVRDNLEQTRGFVVSVRTEAAPLDELSYHLDEQSQTLNIFLRPKEGHYEPSDVSFKSDKFPYDLVMVLGQPSLDTLGRLYDENTDLFFETPIINIDHHANNEHFGEINLIDITATSTTEILVEMLENFEAGLIDADIATNLLAGILIETNSFQHVKTTPKAFLKASSLISMGAEQQEIIRHLYKTKSVSLLKLWGRALARLKEIPALGLSYS